MKLETKCVQSGYRPKSGEPGALPIAMSTTFTYESTQAVGDLFDLKADGFFYTRLANPTTAAVEKSATPIHTSVSSVCSNRMR